MFAKFKSEMKWLKLESVLSPFSALQKLIAGEELTLSQITLAIVIRIVPMMTEGVTFSLPQQQRQDQ